MSDQSIADELLRLKAMRDIIDERMSVLKSQINVGDKIVTDKGIVSCHEQERTTYDERGIYEAVLDNGIDPALLGEVVVKIDRKKVKTASGELLDPYKSVKRTQVVRIEPTDQVRNKVAKEIN